MKIRDIKKTGDKKYPLTVTMNTGKIFHVPQQKEFGKFSQLHGCSLAAVDMALQMSGIRKNPDEVYAWAKTNIGDNYTGSKLTIYGAYKSINGMGGTAEWHSITNTVTSRNKAVRNIRKALSDNCIVLLELKDPIHTTVIIGKRTGGCHVATNGTVKRSTVSRLVKSALTGYSQKSKQRFWYRGGQSNRAAGYVIVKGKEK